MKFIYKASVRALILGLFLAIAPVHQAQAQTADTCTTFAERIDKMQKKEAPPEKGIMAGIHKFVTDTTNDATEKMFVAFTSSDGYQYAVGAAITLMITFYAVGFTMGVVQPNFQQVLVRLIKIGIVTALISSTGWEFFNDYIVKFFQEGTDDLIVKIQEIALNGTPAPIGATPFWALDNVAEFIVQPDTIIAMIGALGAGGPYGLMMGGLLIIACGGFVKLLLEVLKTYAITYVARAMVLGVGPIFFVFLLFDRTKQMFISWVNALINLSLQPILLFTFMSFFIVMIETASAEMLNVELCWGDFRNTEGSANKMAFWRFKDKKTDSIITGDMDWNGALECLVSTTGGKKCKPFPMDILGSLSFLILIYICLRFVEVIKRMSSELSNAFVALDSSGRFEQFMQDYNKQGGKMPANIHQGVPK